MTSYLIDDFVRRASVAESLDSTCIFCQIISDQLPSHKIYEDDQTIAILDIQPIRRGHALVIPKTHIKRLSDLPPALAGSLGATVSHIAGAICRALDINALNVVCNQEYAQAVPHVHYHIVPAPTLTAPIEIDVNGQGQATDSRSIFSRELRRRGELDDAEGSQLAERIKCRL